MYDNLPWQIGIPAALIFWAIVIGLMIRDKRIARRRRTYIMRQAHIRNHNKQKRIQW